jgi:hypothetical protein
MRYMKTQSGQQAFKQRSALLSARQRSAFLMFDGVKTVDAIMQAVAGLGVTKDDVAYLVAQGFLEPSGPAAKADPEAAVGMSMPAGDGPAPAVETPMGAAASQLRNPVERYQDAYPLAVQLVAGLGLRGFRLSLAVEAASGYDELVALFPKIQAAVGVREAMALEAALKG